MYVRLPSRRTIVLQTYPSGDRDFADVIAAALADERRSTNDPEEIRRGVIERVGGVYRNVRLVWQDPFSSLVPRQEILYAFRDASVRPTSADRERLYALLAASRRTIAASRDVLERSDAIGETVTHDDHPPRPRPQPDSELSRR